MTPRTPFSDARAEPVQPPGGRRHHRVACVAAGLVAAAVVFAPPSVDRARAERSTDGPPPAVDQDAIRAVHAPTSTTTAAPVPVAVAQEAMVEVPSLDISLPVVRGGQRVIDQGVAAHYSDTRSRPAVDPGQPGTYWLAAHGSTPGSPFERLAAVADGAQVRITTLAGATFTYTITSRDLVGADATHATVYGPDTTTARILLQTCQGSQRLLVRGVLASKVSV